MAVGTWKVLNKAVKKIGNATINIGAAKRIVLLKTYPALTVSLLGSLTQVSEANGYSSSGKALTTEAWTVSSGGAGTYKFDADDTVWTATGGNITSIKAAAVITSGASAGACHVLCVVSLTSTQFTLNSGSTLTITQPSTGLFVMYN